MIDAIIDEMRNKPHTLLLLAGLYVGGGIMWSNQRSYASEQEVRAVVAQLTQLSVQVQKSALQNRLASANADLFNWLGKQSDLSKKHQPPDPLVEARISQLQGEIEDVRAQLKALQ
jgi:cob(I)alamin adenosyltransferase